MHSTDDPDDDLTVKNSPPPNRAAARDQELKVGAESVIEPGNG